MGFSFLFLILLCMFELFNNFFLKAQMVPGRCSVNICIIGSVFVSGLGYYLFLPL